MPFTENFVYLKEKTGLTKYQIAKDLDCSQSSVKNWETGDVVPRDRARNKIAKYFGITLAELDGDEFPVLPEEGAKKARPVIDEARYTELTDKEKQVLTLFHQIPEQEWDNMLLAVEVSLRSKGLLK